MREFWLGAGSYRDAWRLVWRGRMWPVLAVPGLVGLFYFPAAIILTWLFGSRLADFVRDHWLPGFLQGKFFVVLMAIVFWVAGIYLGLMLFRNFVMILYAPVLDYVSRKTEEKALLERSRNNVGGPASAAPPLPSTGRGQGEGCERSDGHASAIANKPPNASAGILNSALRAISMSLISLVLGVCCFLFCVVLLIVPVVGQISMAVLLPVSQMFLAGHGFMDPALERRGFGVVQSFGFVWRHRGRVMGCGAAFVLLAAVPLIGWFLAPVLGVVAGTLLVLDTPGATKAKANFPTA